VVDGVVKSSTRRLNATCRNNSCEVNWLDKEPGRKSNDHIQSALKEKSTFSNPILGHLPWMNTMKCASEQTILVNLVGNSVV
jgi:hypothetical protein